MTPLLRAALAGICVWAGLLPARVLSEIPVHRFPEPPHAYWTKTPADAFAGFLAKQQGGRGALLSGDARQQLVSLLQALNVPQASQLLAYSATSLQSGLILPSNPRAIYFNEEVYVGYVPGGRLEVAAIDPVLGPVFYLAQSDATGRLQAQRTERCMNCHAGRTSWGVPGLVAESVIATASSGASLDGFRRELATVRHHQLQLARERARLQDEELEASHALVEAVRNVDTNFALAQTNFNRRVAAERQVDAVQAAYDAGQVTLDQLLDAQRRRAEAESSYYRALVDYTRSISQLHFRKGSLLEYNGVFLAEGPWPGKAYFDAHRRARQRDASLYLDYGHSRPGVFSRGPITQNFESIGADAPVVQLPPRDPATRTEPKAEVLPPAAGPGMQGQTGTPELIPTPDVR